MEEIWVSSVGREDGSPLEDTSREDGRVLEENTEKTRDGDDIPGLVCHAMGHLQFRATRLAAGRGIPKSNWEQAIIIRLHACQEQQRIDCSLGLLLRCHVSAQSAETDYGFTHFATHSSYSVPPWPSPSHCPEMRSHRERPQKRPVQDRDRGTSWPAASGRAAGAKCHPRDERESASV